MIKYFKIIAILCCISISIIVLKDGIPRYSHSTNYAGFIAAIILGLVGIGLLIGLFFGEKSPAVGYKTYIRKMRANKLSNDLAEIEQHISALEQCHEDGLLDKKECEAKTERLKSLRETIKNTESCKNEFKQKRETLYGLYESNILTRAEFEEKIKNLRTELQLKPDEACDPDLNENTKIFYISDCVEHGPLPMSYVVYLLKTGRINPNCFYKFPEEEQYTHRVWELLHKQAS